MKLIVQPESGVAPVVNAIKQAKRSIDILIFRLDRPEVARALEAAVARGVRVRALTAHQNRGGTKHLRKLEMQLLEGGVTVSRTADDLVRYHGKMMIVDRRILFLLSFNFVHMDIDHSRGFGLIVTNSKIVQEATRLFDADLNRQAYTGGLKAFIVSPVNAREELSAFIKKAKTQLWIYDPKIADKQILKLLEERAKAGVDIKIIGSLGVRSNLQVTPLTSMRLHTRTIIRDGRQAFVGSQSLRQPELDSRREIGMIVGDPKVVKTLLATFESDWVATGFDETRETVQANTAEAEPQPTAKATKALAKEMPPLKSTLKKAIKQAVTKAGQDSLAHGNLKSTVKSIVKTAMKEAVAEMALESAEK
jgi:phosphatidylserine/phosphatidylglycerophosphate/cardiolipin synthase-like enzyme